jgi:4-amino-4-deoxy-L-arabinose transferase-like glycosyltransferase
MGVGVVGSRRGVHTERPARASTRRRAVLLTVASGALVYVLLLGRPVVRSDEAWFTWVTQRIRSGDTLYRSVYYVSTPLAAWLGTAWSLVGGTSVASMRVLSVAVFVASGAVVWWTARRAHMGVIGRLALIAALFVYASPVADFASIYSSLAILCALTVARLHACTLFENLAFADDDRGVPASIPSFGG